MHASNAIIPIKKPQKSSGKFATCSVSSQVVLYLMEILDRLQMDQLMEYINYNLIKTQLIRSLFPSCNQIRKTRCLPTSLQLSFQLLYHPLQLQLLRFVHNLHVRDHAILLYLGLAGLLGRVVDANALTALRGSTSSRSLYLPLQSLNFAYQFFVGEAYLLQLSTCLLVFDGQCPLGGYLQVHIFYLFIEDTILGLQLLHLLPQNKVLLLSLVLGSETTLLEGLLVEILTSTLLRHLQFPETQTLIVEFYIVLMQLPVGLAQILVADEVVATASPRDNTGGVIAVQQLRGLFQLFEDVDLGGDLLCAPVGLPARLYQRLLVEEDWAEFVPGLVLHLVELAQAMKQLLNVFLASGDGLRAQGSPCACIVKVLHFEYNNKCMGSDTLAAADIFPSSLCLFAFLIIILSFMLNEWLLLGCSVNMGQYLMNMSYLVTKKIIILSLYCQFLF